MKNIHLILANKAVASLYHCSNTRDLFTTRQTSDDLLYEVYITSDEEIKEGNHFYDIHADTIHKAISIPRSYEGNINNSYIDDIKRFNKIILTTDQDLIKDGVQSIDDEFLEWFVKNPSCDEIEVESNYRVKSGTIQEHKEGKAGYEYYDYKIIIPKEELHSMDDEVECNNCGNIMSLIEDGSIYVCYNSECTSCYEYSEENEPKQETLEEAAERYEEDDFNQSPTEESAQMMIQRAFITGAKWQQERMYSEEDMQEYAKFCIRCYDKGLPCIIAKDWFEQFKK